LEEIPFSTEVIQTWTWANPISIDANRKIQTVSMRQIPNETSISTLTSNRTWTSIPISTFWIPSPTLTSTFWNLSPIWIAIFLIRIPI
jgi:SRSO17 transposase